VAELLDRKRVSRDFKSWLDCVAAYETKFQSWEGRVEKIIKRFVDKQDELKSGTGQARFNILWSNVQTLKAATFSRLPKPDVSRRFKDQDPVGRVAALILERALDYEIQHYQDYRASMDSVVLDRFLGGRGTSWVRYEPHMRATQLAQPTDGLGVTEDVDEGQEELDYECAPTDYVHWKDFGHSNARTWEEVKRVWRRVYMGREALVERFGEEVGSKIPLDATPDDTERNKTTVSDTACIYEGWDKETKKAVWFHKSFKDFLDQRDDPLGLEDFFPCPKPLYSTLSNDSLIPTPDFTLYQDQARELDVLCDRIDGLIKALKVAGCYDSSNPVLARIFTEGENTTLFPVKNWAAFAEKQGLKGSIDIVDLKPIYEALRAAYEAMVQVREQVYEITGISDIVRGQTQASETATAQQIKGQYASLRLKSYQDQVAFFATQVLQIKGQVICNKFDPQTIAMIAGVNEFPEADKQYIGPAMELLLGPRIQDPESQAPNPMRAFRIEVAADSMVYLDEQAEKEARVEFLTATGTFLEKIVMSLASVPKEMVGPLLPLLLEMLKFGVTGYRVGKSMEGIIDQATQQLIQLAGQPQAPDPKQMEEQIRAQIENDVAMKNASKEIEHNKRAADLDIREMKFNAEQQLGKLEADFTKREADLAARDSEVKAKTSAEYAKLEEAKASAVKDSMSKVEKDESLRLEALQALAQQMSLSTQQTQQMVASLMQIMTKPKRIIRGPDGRAAGVETLN